MLIVYSKVQLSLDEVLWKYGTDASHRYRKSEESRYGLSGFNVYRSFANRRQNSGSRLQPVGIFVRVKLENTFPAKSFRIVLSPDAVSRLELHAREPVDRPRYLVFAGHVKIDSCTGYTKLDRCGRELRSPPNFESMEEPPRLCSCCITQDVLRLYPFVWRRLRPRRHIVVDVCTRGTDFVSARRIAVTMQALVDIMWMLSVSKSPQDEKE
ncbi:hypothetical protein BKA82DRAFT_4009655 [Pisolithus tinctorius]|nr:hypothetical protein BKA82DRAFT_4009655 [Pisolithus tinctorius]